MDRRRFLASGLGLAVAGALGRPARAVAGTEAAQARALYDRIFEQILLVAPQLATRLGLDTGPRAGARSLLNGRGRAYRLGPLGPLAQAWPAVQEIDATQLEGTDRTYLATVAWLASISRELEAQPIGTVDAYNYPVPYVVTQLTGAYQSTPDFLESDHPIETAADAAAYLDRLDMFGYAVANDTALAREHLGRGLRPPDFICDKTLKQLRLLRGQPGARSGMVTSLVRRTREQGISGDWGARAARIVDGPLARALDAQIKLVEEQRLRATHEAGIRGRPGGEAYYPLCLRYQTSTRMTPDEAHELGVAQVQEISAATDELLRSQGHTDGTVGARLAALTRDPQWLYPNDDTGRAQLIAELNRQVAGMQQRLPELFGVLPRTRVEVRRVPPEIELGAPRGYARTGSLDGTQPGAYYINLADTGIWPRWALPTLTYHESVPGHHLQGTIALESADTPLLHRTLLLNAFVEGWGLYAEQLADEIGIYADFPLGRLGLLQSFLYRAVRIVVDTGMHWRGWSREQAARYMADSVGLARGAVESEIDRYCVWPAQACGYKIGHLEFVRLREVARARLGPRFDLRGFHDAVLAGGPVPLEVLAQVVDAWTSTAGEGDATVP